jgi:transposase
MTKPGMEGSSPQPEGMRGGEMRTPDEVAAMLRLNALGWGTKRIAKELGCSRGTVKRYVAAQGWSAYRRPKRPGVLAGLEGWLAERFRQHRGNADVVRQELAREHGLSVSLRTVERAVAPLRQGLRAEALATVRFETPPGRQLQIDFGELRVSIADEPVKVFLFVATLGYSRRSYVQAFAHERQSAWFDGLEGAFQHFGGVCREVLLDNPRALVDFHDPVTREVRFNQRFLAFARYWGFKPRACAPYRARTKGKDERGVGYVKRNGIAGRRFAGWAALEAHLAEWLREIADVREHGTTGEPPIERFRREEAGALQPIAGRPPFSQVRDLKRQVQSDCCVEVDTNAYSVPWRLIGEAVRVVVSGGRVRVEHAGREVAVHNESAGRRQRLVEPAHFAGISPQRSPAPEPPTKTPPPDLLRPLQEYERLVGGGW